MSSRTTKAQRRAAKLHRRSKDYRRQIAAQARKDEQAKKPAKKQTHTKAKNPSPKKVYEPETTSSKLLMDVLDYDKLRLYRKGIDVPLIIYVRVSSGRVHALIGGFDWDGATKIYPDLKMPEVAEAIAEQYDPNFKATFGVIFPMGTDLNELHDYAVEEGTIDYIEGLFDAMERKKKIAASADFVKVVKSMRMWSRNAA